MFKNISEPIVELVLNISEGRSQALIHKISKILSVNGRVHVIHVAVGFDANRTVFTVVGVLEDLCRAIEEVIKFASANLDIKLHKGIHPRLGIIDVIPFIAIHGISKNALKQYIQNWCTGIADRYQLPIYYYGALAQKKANAPLGYFRKLGKENLSVKIQEHFRPDVGPNRIHRRLGASCVTVRDYMLAYNVNLNTSDLKKAKALSQILITKRNNPKYRTDLDISDVKFLAWHMPQYSMCQISTNIYDIKKVTLLELYRYISKEAQAINLEVQGSELIGLCPMDGIAKKTPIGEAVNEIGLNSLSPLRQEERILELVFADLEWESP